MEMKNETNKCSCSHGEEMLAYLYDELSPAGRERFETHLESCFECIDEFAELAVSRYSVFEWKSVEFVPMATPRFVIPAERKPVASSWLDSIKAAFAWNGWALAGGGAAMMLFAVIGIGFWNFQSDGPIADNDAASLPAGAPAAVQNQMAPTNVAEPDQAELAEVVPSRKPRPERAVVQPQASQRKRSDVANVVTGRKTPSATETRRPSANERLQNSPTLGQYVEDPDESLRLSDIFDDLEMRDME